MRTMTWNCPKGSWDNCKSIELCMIWLGVQSRLVTIPTNSSRYIWPAWSICGQCILYFCRCVILVLNCKQETLLGKLEEKKMNLLKIVCTQNCCFNVTSYHFFLIWLHWLVGQIQCLIIFIMREFIVRTMMHNSTSQCCL